MCLLIKGSSKLHIKPSDFLLGILLNNKDRLIYVELTFLKLITFFDASADLCISDKSVFFLLLMLSHRAALCMQR